MLVCLLLFSPVNLGITSSCEAIRCFMSHFLVFLMKRRFYVRICFNLIVIFDFQIRSKSSKLVFPWFVIILVQTTCSLGTRPSHIACLKETTTCQLFFTCLRQSYSATSVSLKKMNKVTFYAILKIEFRNVIYEC